jgi:hypothetical protein
MSDIHEGVTLGEGASGQPVVERALDHLVHLVNRLIRREMATAAALDTAAEHLDAGEDADLARHLEGCHRDQIEHLGALASELGGEPAAGSNLRSLIDRARVRLRELRGDRGILDALAAIEDELCAEYREVIATVGFTDDERELLSVGLAAAADAVRRLRATAAH